MTLWAWPIAGDGIFISGKTCTHLFCALVYLHITTGLTPWNFESIVSWFLRDGYIVTFCYQRHYNVSKSSKHGLSLLSGAHDACDIGFSALRPRCGSFSSSRSIKIDSERYSPKVAAQSRYRGCVVTRDTNSAFSDCPTSTAANPPFQTPPRQMVLLRFYLRREKQTASVITSLSVWQLGGVCFPSAGDTFLALRVLFQQDVSVSLSF